MSLYLMSKCVYINSYMLFKEGYLTRDTPKYPSFPTKTSTILETECCPAAFELAILLPHLVVRIAGTPGQSKF